MSIRVLMARDLHGRSPGLDSPPSHGPREPRAVCWAARPRSSRRNLRHPRHSAAGIWRLQEQRPDIHGARTQRLIEAAKRSFPRAPSSSALGLLVAGLTTYGFQILSFRALSKADYTALNGLWVVAFVLAPGFFLPLEQEVGRALADRRARGIGGGPVVKRAAIAGALLSGSLIAIALIGRGRDRRARGRRPVGHASSTTGACSSRAS